MAVYDDAAVWYDRLWGRQRNYAADAAAISELVEARNPDARRVLDVGCGTGEHLRQLRPRFDVAGVDASAGLLDVARRKLGSEPALYHADMFDLDLAERFDVILCLWGTVGYASTAASLRHLAALFAAHSARGGIVIVEPWLSPAAFDATDRVTVVVDETEDPVLTAVTTTRRDGSVAQLRRLYIAATDGGIHTVEEHHRLGVFDETDYREAFGAAGFQVDWRMEGLAGRGLLIGTLDGSGSSP